ncbi:MAG TPA: glycosyltransferase family 2 protein [Patescibacteria group bacterium]
MLSVVVPVFNEEESLKAFFAELIKVVPALSADYEIIFVDDGSVDKSLEILKGFVKKYKKIKIFAFRKNIGKAEALTFGFIQAKGEYIVTLDADLQDIPSEIHKLLAKTKEGVEVVCGWRKNRKDKSRMKIISKLFNFFASNFFGLRIHDYNCGLKVYTHDAAKSLRLYGGLHRFIPLIVHQQGFIVDEVEVAHQARKFGKSKYGFSKLWRDLPDMFTMLFLVKYSKRPLHFFGVAGSLLLLLGVGIFTYLSVLWFGGETIGRRPLFFTSILLIISGLQVFFTGFLADLMINIAQNAQGSETAHIHFPLKYSSDKQEK